MTRAAPPLGRASRRHDGQHRRAPSSATLTGSTAPSSCATMIDGDTSHPVAQIPGRHSVSTCRRRTKFRARHEAPGAGGSAAASRPNAAGSACRAARNCARHRRHVYRARDRTAVCDPGRGVALSAGHRRLAIGHGRGRRRSALDSVVAGWEYFADIVARRSVCPRHPHLEPRRLSSFRCSTIYRRW